MFNQSQCPAWEHYLVMYENFSLKSLWAENLNFPVRVSFFLYFRISIYGQYGPLKYKLSCCVSCNNVSWTFIYFDLNVLWTELNWTMVAWPTALKLGQFVNLAILLPMDSNPFKYSGTNVPKIFLNDCFLYPTIFDDLRKVGQFRHLLKLRNNFKR